MNKGGQGRLDGGGIEQRADQAGEAEGARIKRRAGQTQHATDDQLGRLHADAARDGGRGQPAAEAKGTAPIAQGRPQREHGRNTQHAAGR